jgi:hypothetical protein
MPRVKKGEPSGRDKIKAFLLNNIGRVLTTEEIRDASGGQGQYGRRLRELREKFGWPIDSHNDNKNLKPGQYMMTGPPPEEGSYSFERNISAKVRALVLARNGYCCRHCGITTDEIDPKTGRKARLHIGHIRADNIGGEAEIDNLRALCSTCNQGQKNLTDEPPSWSWLLAALRRADEANTRRAYEWLQTKYGAK